MKMHGFKSALLASVLCSFSAFAVDYTPLLTLGKPEPLVDPNWGVTLNADFDILDNALLTNGSGINGRLVVFSDDHQAAPSSFGYGEVVLLTGVQTLNSKDIDTANGNALKIGGVSLTALSGNTGTVMTGSGSFTLDHYAKFDASGNVVDGGTGLGSSVPPFDDTTAILQDDGDNTKQLKFSIGGFTTATTRTLTVPDADDTLTLLAVAQTLSNKTFDSASNTFKINGTTITSISGNTASLLSSSGSVTSGNLYKADANGNAVDAGFSLTAGSGVSTVALTTTGSLTSGHGLVIDANGDAIDSGAAPTGHGIQDEGVDLATEPKLNFVGAGVTCVDDSGNSQTDCTINATVPPFADDTAIVKDDADNTKLMAFQLSGLTTATTRTFTVPDRSATMATTTGTLTSGNCAEFDASGNLIDSGGACGSTLPVTDTTSIVEGSADATKEIRFEVDGLTTATVRVLTPPDANITLAGQDFANTFTAAQTLNATNEMRYADTDSSNYVGFKAPGTVGTNVIWTLPDADSSGTQCLSSNGSAVMGWSACSGGGGSPGGADTQIQYNNGGAFGGSAKFTFDDTTIDGRIVASGGTVGSAGGEAAALFNASGTFNTSEATDAAGAYFNYTGAGTASSAQQALHAHFTAGYTGTTAYTAAGVFANANTGAANTLQLTTAAPSVGNTGVVGYASGSTTGLNVGVEGMASASTGNQIGIIGKSVGSSAAPHVGVLGLGYASTEGTDLKNVGGFFSTDVNRTSLPTGDNHSYALYAESGTMENGDRVTNFLGTFPTTPTGHMQGSYMGYTSAGSAAFREEALRVELLAGYTGSTQTAALAFSNQAAGTGTTLALGSTFGIAANVGLNGSANASTTGYNIGGALEALNSTGVNIGAEVKANGSAAGTNIGLLANAANSTEATDLKNVAVYGTLNSSLLSGTTYSAAGLFDGGTLADANTYALKVLGTLASAPSAATVGATFNFASNGSAAQQQFGVNSVLTSGYTGSSGTIALASTNQAAGTGATLNLATGSNPTANLGFRNITSASTAGYNIGSNALAVNSSTLNVGFYGQATGTDAGVHVAMLGSAANSTQATDFKNIGGAFTLHTALPTGSNTSVALIADGAGSDIFRGYNAATIKFTIDANGNIISIPLKTTGSAGSKNVVCVDTTTGQLYASSTTTDCSN